MPRYLLTLQYLGTNYAGWQTQANATGVQQVVEKALGTLANVAVTVESSGRTDSGVHARAQKAHVDLPFEIDSRGLVMGANNLLPRDIRVTEAQLVPDDFHARFLAKRKTYRYQIWNHTVCDVFKTETHAHVPGPLDDDAMHVAAQALVGTHDFKMFTVTEPEVRSTIRNIESITVTRDAEAVSISVTGAGFLRYMVRRIAGSLIQVGRGRLDGAGVAASLEPTFAVARWTAPPNGLVLYDVSYADQQP